VPRSRYDHQVSGEAGASSEGELYQIAIGTGVIVNVALPPGNDGSAIGAYFARASAPYERWLARARPELDALFAQLVVEGEPLVPIAQKFEELAGTFLEDGDDRNFAKYHKGGPLALRLNGSRHMPRHRSLDLFMLVSRRVEKAKIEAIVARVAAVLVGTQAEPAPPLPPAAPVIEPPRSWWARLLGRR
jgi:hypothetical protein